MAPPAAGPKSPPKIVSSPQELAIQLGQPLSLTCGVQGNPRPTVTWYFNGKDTAGLAGFRLAEKGNSVSLEISRFDVPCFGNYLCVARNELGEAKFTLALDAQADQLGSSAERLEPPDLKDWDFVKKADFLINACGTLVHIIPLPRVGSTHGSNVAAWMFSRSKDFEGEGTRYWRRSPSLSFHLPNRSQEAGGNLSVEFKCRATGQPPPDVLWYRGARKLRSDADFVVTYEKGEVSFLIKKVNKSSSGEYKCVASNPAGKSTTTARLAVKEPDRTWNRLEVTSEVGGVTHVDAEEQLVGGKVRYIIDDISTAASVNGSPQAQKAQAQTLRDSTLVERIPQPQTIKVQTHEDRSQQLVGSYEAVGPEFSQPQEFRIKVAGDPHPTIQWQKGKFLKIKEGPRYHVLFDEETKEDVMVIKELRPADAGTYKCNVFNPGGQANCAVVLHVKDRKDISEEEVLKILEKTDPKDYERVALMYGITDFRNLLKHVHIKKKKSWSQPFVCVHTWDVQWAPKGSKREGWWALLKRKVHSGELEEAMKKNCSLNENDLGTKKPAEIVKELEDVEGQQEKEVTFMAEVVINDKDLKVEWEKNLDILTPGQKYKMEHKGDLVMLTIKDLRHDDEGKYKLVVGDCTSSAMLVVKKAPARFRGLMKGCTVFLHERAEFTVEVSRADAELQWFFKGKPIDFTTKRYAIETMGNRRTLVIRRTEFEDMGDYSCSTGDDKTQAKLTVKEERYKFTSELRDCEAPVGGDARFECEVSSESAKVTWFRNKEELTAGEKYQIIKEGLRHVLIIKNIEMEKDRGQYICKTKDGSSTGKLIIREPPPGFVSELKSLTGFFKRDVTLECEVAKEDARVKWFKNGKEINLARLKGKYDCQVKGTRRILIIKNLAWDDTAEYSCEAPGGKTSCTMTVEEAPIEFKQQLKDSKAFPKESVTFECELSTEDTEVHWFRNGVEIKMGGRYQIKKDGLKRYLIITGLTMEDMGEYTIEAGIKRNSTKPVKIEKGLKDVSALDKDPELVLEATISELDGEVSWLWNGKPIPKELFDSGKFKVVSDKKKRKLVITNVGRDDGGEYTLVTKDGKSSCNVSVSDRPVKIKSKLKDVKALDKDPEVTLEAEVSEPDGEVTWLKDGKPIPKELLDSGKVQIIADGKKRKLKIKDLGKDDAGEYTLKTNDGTSSCKLGVEDRPVKIKSGLKDVKAMDKDPEVTLEAEVSEADGAVTWLKNGKPIPKALLDSGKLQIVADGKKRKLVIKNPGKDDAGEYTLVTKDGKSNCKINVTDEPVKITKELQPVKVTEGDKAELACEVHKDGAQVQWLKNGKPIPDKDLKNIKIVADGKTHKLIFLDAEPKDSGEYSVKTTGGTSNAKVNVKEIPAGFTSSLNGAECEYGEDVTFAVELTKPKAEVKWLLNGKVIDPDRPRGKYQVVTDGTKRKLIVKNCNGKDNGEITCVFGDKEATSQLKVNEPVGIKKGLEGSVLKEEEKGKLTVELNREKPGGGDIKWFKNGKEITLGGKYKMQRDGNKCHLLIDPVDLTDNAEFTCMAGDSSTSAKATVDEKPAIITSELQVPEVIEGEKAEFVLGLNKDNKLDKIKWFKDGKEVYESSRIHLQQRGNNYVLVINRAQMEDAGTWSCQIDGSTSQGTFVVNACSSLSQEEQEKLQRIWRSPALQDDNVIMSGFGRPLFQDDDYQLTLEPPLKITSKLRRVDAIEGEDVKFELEVSRENGEVTWFKDGVEINPAANPDKYEIKVIGLKRVLIVKGCALGDSGQITVVAEKDKKTAVLNVEKPFQMERVPTFTLPLRDTGFFAGKTIVLTVTVSVHPEPDITWTKNGQEVLPGGRVRFSKDYGRYTLEILNAQPEDEGEYAVTAVNPFGKDFTSCKVTPKTRGHEEDWYVPLFRRYMVTQEVLQGKDARFECKVNGNPVPEVK
ncbi:hypothetical protein Bbelb_245200, partial [Branchiostoma belcheri]